MKSILASAKADVLAKYVSCRALLPTLPITLQVGATAASGSKLRVQKLKSCLKALAVWPKAKRNSGDN
jgi:hypothetical protein